MYFPPRNRLRGSIVLGRTRPRVWVDVKQVESNTGETPSDAELILQVRSGDREAFGVLYERHASAARALARQYVSPADAEDVVADAFSKLFEMLRRGAGPDAGFRPYLYTVVRHRAFDV